MDVKKYKEKNNLSSDDVVNILQPLFPKFSRSPLSMVQKGTYGVVLAPKAVKALEEAHPSKKPNRKKGHQLTVRLDDVTYHYFQELCSENNVTAQLVIEEAIKRIVFPYVMR